jgi:hypothetical protein
MHRSRKLTKEHLYLFTIARICHLERIEGD